MIFTERQIESFKRTGCCWPERDGTYEGRCGNPAVAYDHDLGIPLCEQHRTRNRREEVKANGTQ